MIKRLFVYIFAFLVIGIDVFGQKTESTQRLLDLVEQQFNSKQYDEIIQTANKAIFDKGVVKDSCFFLLMNYKALAFNHKYQNDSAIAILKNAIDLYEIRGNRDSILRTLYRNYLDISSFYIDRNNSNIYDEALYKDYSIKLLRLVLTVGRSTEDLERYGKGLTARLKKTKGNIQKKTDEYILNDAIYQEKELVNDVLTALLDSYFTLVSARVVEKDVDFKKLIDVLEEYYYENGYDKDVYIKEWLNECYGHYFSLAESYYKNGYVEAAVEYYQVALDYFKRTGNDYIIEEGRNRRENTINDCVLKYIAFLQAANRFEKVVDYCHEVIDNPFFDSISIDTTYYLSMITDYKNIVLTIANNPQKKIDPFNFRFEDEIYKNINNEIDYCFPYIYSSLKYRVYNEKLIDIWNVEDYNKQIDAWIDYLEKDIIKIYYEWFGFDETNSIKQKSSTFEEFLVSMGKLQWEEDVMGFETWISCGEIAHLYYLENDYDNSVKWQQMAVDIVELDTDTSRWDGYENYMSIYNLDHDNIGITHINVEFLNYRKLAFYFKEAKQFDKSIEYYSKAVNLYMQVLQSVFKGSDMYKEQVWENHKTILSDIIYEIIGDCDEYPPFGDLVLELDALQKGFLAWQKIALKDAVGESNDKTIRSIYDRKLNIEKDIELSYYKTLEQKGRAELFGELADYEGKLKSQIGTNNILDRTVLKTEGIKQSLSTNDVYVDFIEVPVDTLANVIFKVNGRIIETKYITKYLYAIIMRKQWEHPKIISLGKNTDDYPMEWLSYSFNDNAKKDEQEQIAIINEMYLDTVLSHYIWNKVIVLGEIREGDNIYYIPDGYLYRIAIESLSFDGETRISDLYNCYRMSSARELLKKKSKISKTDKCLGVGGLQYSKSRPLAIDGQQKKKDSKKTPFFAFNSYRKRNTALSSMFNRDILEPLSGSQAELAYLSESFGESVTILNGTIGTENYVLQSINRIKPSILHIGTHGFNCINKDLSTEEDRFLFGVRDGYVSPMENSLYRTGLYMSLPQYESSKTASNGIITAKEISMTDLSNTKLVALSACSTALGNVNSEGVYGLQRGLKLAGAESMLVSLWDVNDKSTELLMKEFYKQLSMGKTRREALQKAQEAVRNYDEDLDDCDIGEYKTFEAPYYWAGFVLIDGNE